MCFFDMDYSWPDIYVGLAFIIFSRARQEKEDDHHPEPNNDSDNDPLSSLGDEDEMKGVEQAGAVDGNQ